MTNTYSFTINWIEFWKVVAGLFFMLGSTLVLWQLESPPQTKEQARWPALAWFTGSLILTLLSAADVVR